MRYVNYESIVAGGAKFLMTASGLKNCLTTLLFHKIPVSADPLAPDEMCLAQFVDILDFLADFTSVISLNDAVKALAGGKTLPNRALAITFDDGYAEWTKHVVKELKQRNLPATFFIATEALTGSALWHERIVAAVRALPNHGAVFPYGFAALNDLSENKTRVGIVRVLQERLKYASLEDRISTIEMLERQAILPLILPDSFTAHDVRALHSMGFGIGAHTVHHPILTECNDDDALTEIGGAKEILETIIGGRVDSFAYPNGRPRLDFNSKHVEMTKACGYKSAVTSRGGIAISGTDLFQIPRMTPWSRSRLHLCYHLLRNARTARSEVTTKKRGDMLPQTDVRCLLIASTFAPIHGGSAVVYKNLCAHMPIDSMRVLTAKRNYLTNKPIEGWQTHDEKTFYPIDRIDLLRPLMQSPPNNILVSLKRFVFEDLLIYVNSLYQASKIVKKHDINIICVGELVTGSWLGFALRKLHGCRVIIYVHGEEITTKTGGRLHGNLRSNYLHAADKIISVSSFTCDVLASDMNLSPGMVSLINNGVDTELFSPGVVDVDFYRNKNLIGKTIILTVGRLVPRKGIDMSIRAMVNVISSVPNAHHIIIGDGDYKKELETIILNEGLLGRVTLAGKVSDDEMLSYFRACDIFVMPNRTMADGDTEGFGLVFREANACGKAVVGGRAGGAVEAVVDGVTGILVDGNNINEISAAIIKLLTRSDLRNTMGMNGLEIAKKNSTKSVAERFLKICENVLYRDQPDGDQLLRK